MRTHITLTSKSGSLALCEGNSPVTYEFPTKELVTPKKLPFDGVIKMICHDGNGVNPLEAIFYLWALREVKTSKKRKYLQNHELVFRYQQMAPIMLHGAAIWDIPSAHNVIYLSNSPEVGNMWATASTAYHGTSGCSTILAQPSQGIYRVD